MNAVELVHARDVEQQPFEAKATIEALLSSQIDAVVDSKTQSPVLLSKAQDSEEPRLQTAGHWGNAPRLRVSRLGRFLDGRTVSCLGRAPY
jgi:hypothetical protein